MTQLEGKVNTLRGMIDEPTADQNISDISTVNGWVYSKAAPIKKIEIWLGDQYLGQAYQIIERPDVAAVYPLEAPLRTGYFGTFEINPGLKPTGSHILSVQVVDEKGNQECFTRQVKFKPSLDFEVYKSLLTKQYLSILDNFLASGNKLTFPQHEKPVISILLVLFNRAELTLQCLISLNKSSQVAFEIVLVDNNSTDRTSKLLDQLEGVTIIRNTDNFHFLLGANQAAKAAKGNYLLFLNNDAQVLSGSLESAVRTLESASDIGAVGGKILLLDGSLQEAGSIVWQDGSNLGYGRGDKPFAPMYMFQRDVDYCSGAFLLTRQELFRELGGFDEAYRPAYYEETDYCLKLWSTGKRVVYDPTSVILHFEFASSKSSQAAIDLQLRNKSTFCTNQASQLQLRYPFSSKNILFARTTLKNWPRVLFIEDRCPHSYLGSGLPRARQLLLSMVELGCFVTLYPTITLDESWEQLYQDIPRTVEIMHNYGLFRLEHFLYNRQNYYDLIIISRPHNMERFNLTYEHNPGWFTNTKIVYDAEALFTMREVTQAQLNSGTISEENIWGKLTEEVKLALPADEVLCVSSQEQQLFKQYGIKSTSILGHAVEVDPTPQEFENRKGLLFVGPFYADNTPNTDAVTWFTRHVFPRLQNELDGKLEFNIIGMNKSKKIDLLDADDVHVLGRIDELEPFYNQARVFVAPIRYAAGIPIKIIEAAARGLPVVTTSILARQLGWQAGEDLLVADTVTDFAERCLELLTDIDLWGKVRNNALARVKAEYSSASFQSNLTRIIYG